MFVKWLNVNFLAYLKLIINVTWFLYPCTFFRKK